ncbi:MULTISPECIES: hypothetical protein [Streptomyces]|uniref:Uncharacterized protein n=1 Tax=Streptomyces viridochromogenes TaxID=1938 RepID=A0A0L8LDR1_STRVR|nr:MULTISPECIES: hypothetical protein [Streptomyces]KOG36272.1 hypothetical protein ADK34_02425 [Streptomyces viridochromogenes]
MSGGPRLRNAEWFTVPGAAAFDPGGQVTSVSRSGDHLDLFAVGNDRRVWTHFWSARAGWAADWFPVPGQAVFDPAQRVAAVSRRSDQLDLFVLGHDHHVWSTFWHHDTVRSGLAGEPFTPIPRTLQVDDPGHFARHPPP